MCSQTIRVGRFLIRTENLDKISKAFSLEQDRIGDAKYKIWYNDKDV